ncbi:MAG: hypothetical protein AAF658_10795 [Myxococcota bacterium]
MTGICSAGRCVECLTTGDCNDGNSCTVDACGPEGLCIEPPVPVGDPCIGESGICNESAQCRECLNSQNVTSSDQAIDGRNARCSTQPGNPNIDLQCQIATCNADDTCEIISVPNTNTSDGQPIACNDGSSQTVNDICNGGRCAGCRENDCQDFLQTNGVCTPTNVRDGLSCSSGSNGAAVGTSPVCDLGFCVGCAGLNNFSSCRQFEHQNDGDGNVSPNDDCVNIGRPSSQSCQDNNQCTGTGNCQGTVCVNTPILNGAACNDGNACSTASQCNASGSCVPTSFVSCPSNSTCSGGVCVCRAANQCAFGGGTVCCANTQVCCNNGVGCRPSQSDCGGFGG